ncbi:MAG: hypothetical protein ACFE78_04985 [Candidatus Hodarchaeota archaeon]
MKSDAEFTIPAYPTRVVLTNVVKQTNTPDLRLKSRLVAMSILFPMK